MPRSLRRSRFARFARIYSSRRRSSRHAPLASSTTAERRIHGRGAGGTGNQSSYLAPPTRPRRGAGREEAERPYAWRGMWPLPTPYSGIARGLAVAARGQLALDRASLRPAQERDRRRAVEETRVASRTRPLRVTLGDLAAHGRFWCWRAVRWRPLASAGARGVSRHSSGSCLLEMLVQGARLGALPSRTSGCAWTVRRAIVDVTALPHGLAQGHRGDESSRRRVARSGTAPLCGFPR